MATPILRDFFPRFFSVSSLAVHPLYQKPIGLIAINSEILSNIWSGAKHVGNNNPRPHSKSAGQDRTGFLLVRNTNEL